MNFRRREDAIVWRLHLRSAPAAVYEMLATDEGRARFWAESAIEDDGAINFIFPNGLKCRCTVAGKRPPHSFEIEYICGDAVKFELRDDGAGGTDLTLINEGVPESERLETLAGWVSVLMALKAAVDFGVDLRNHDRRRTWDEGFVEN